MHLLTALVVALFIRAFSPHPGGGLGFVVVVLLGYAARA
jgi:uncharacterized membrane protein YbhN (UPF0104 family)